MKKFYWLIFLATFVSCTKKTPKGQVVVAYSQAFNTLDPQMVDSSEQARMLSLCYQQLLGYAPSTDTYTFSSELADGMPSVSKDGETLVIKLKKGRYFSDHPSFEEGKGREITSNDFVYSLLRLADPKLSSPNFWLIENKIIGIKEWRIAQNQSESTNYNQIPEGINIKDSYTVELKLKVDAPQLLHSLTHIGLSVVPRESVEKLQGDFAKSPVCSGPYRFLRWRTKESLEFEKNPTYSSEEASTSIQTVRYEFFEDPVKAFVAFKVGKVDLTRVPPQEIRDVVNLENRSLKDHHIAKGWKLHELSVLNTSFVIFNMQDPMIKRAGVKFRQAVSLAVDRESLNISSSQGASHISHSPIPPQVFGHEVGRDNPFAKFDRVKAKQLLKESGWKDSQALTLSVYEGANTFVKFLVEGLEGIGIKVEVEKKSLSAFMGSLQNKKFQVSFMTWEADYPDAENFLQLLYGPNGAPSPNFANFQDSRFDQNFKKMRALQDGVAKKALLEKLHQRVVAEMPWALMLHDAAFYTSSKRLKGLDFRHLLGESPLLGAVLEESVQD
ncbi:ABC transporter substrate-binding protein [bacterium]|nr:ABC transporter substrate-binding protein [bacterium]